MDYWNQNDNEGLASLFGDVPVTGSAPNTTTPTGFLVGETPQDTVTDNTVSLDMPAPAPITPIDTEELPSNFIGEGIAQKEGTNTPSTSATQASQPVALPQNNNVWSNYDQALANGVTEDIAPKIDMGIVNSYLDDVDAWEAEQLSGGSEADVRDSGYEDSVEQEERDISAEYIDQYNIPVEIPINEDYSWVLDRNTLNYTKKYIGVDTGDYLRAGVIALGTAGLGAALAPAITALAGTTSAVSSGIGSAVASGAVTGLQGGDMGDVLKAATLSGISGYTSGIASELETAKNALDAAQAAGNVAEAAELANTVSTLENVLSTATNVNNVTQFANAVDQGANPIQAALSFFGENIADFIDIDDTLNQGFAEIFNQDVADALTGDSAFTTLLLDQAAGRNLGDSIAERYGSKIAENLGSDTQNGQAFALGAIEAIAEYGENGVASDAIVNGVREYIDKGGDAEDIKEFLGEIVPKMPGLGEGPDLGWIEDTLREAGRQFDDSVLQPTKEFLESLVPDIDLPDLPDVNLPDLPDVNLPDIDLPDLPDGPDINLPDTPELPDMPDISVPNLLSLLGAGGGMAPTGAGGSLEVDAGGLVELDELFDFSAGVDLADVINSLTYDGQNMYNQPSIGNNTDINELLRLIEGS